MEINGGDFNTIEDFEKTDEWEWIKDTICSATGATGIVIDDFDGYIDHQSYEGYSKIKEFLEDYSTDLLSFVFDTGITLYIDNDNH